MHLFVVLGLTLSTAFAQEPIPVAVVGGLSLSGVWQQIVTHAQRDLNVQIDTVVSSPKEGVTAAFAQSKAHLLIIHSSDEASALEAADLGTAMRVWAWNEHVVVGPKTDPAQIKGLNAKEAIARLEHMQSPFIAFRDPGSYAVVQRIWRQLGLRPSADWVQMDHSQHSSEVLNLAAANDAYIVVGHIPVQFHKMPLPDSMEILIKGDPIMRRPYVILTPGPKHKATVEQREQAEKIASYLLSTSGQTAIQKTNAALGGVWLYPRNQGLPGLF